MDLTGSKGDFILALGFGLNYAEAAQRTLASFSSGFETARSTYIREWKDWQRTLQPLIMEDAEKDERELISVSAAVLRTHESKRFPGGLIASLSGP